MSLEIKEAYNLAGIDSSKLIERYKKVIDSILMQIINICHKTNKPLSEFESEFKKIGKEIRKPELKWYD